MKTWYCWYDNGTGWYEGPWEVEAESEQRALEKEQMQYAYAAFATTNKNYDPNKNFMADHPHS